VAVGALEVQFWSALVAALGLDEASTPSPYNPADWQACAKVLTDAFRAKTRDEWAAIFAPLDACVAPVLTLEEALSHPHNVERGSFVDVGGTAMPGPAPRFSRTPAAAGTIMPIGGATAELLAEVGYGTQDVARLRDSGVIG
jgi:alpha-methylacyl-CoA racemase